MAPAAPAASTTVARVRVPTMAASSMTRTCFGPKTASPRSMRAMRAATVSDVMPDRSAELGRRPGRQRRPGDREARLFPRRPGRLQGHGLAAARLAHHHLDAVARTHQSAHEGPLFVGQRGPGGQRPTRGRRVSPPPTAVARRVSAVDTSRPSMRQQFGGGVQRPASGPGGSRATTSSGPAPGRPGRRSPAPVIRRPDASAMPRTTSRVSKVEAWAVRPSVPSRARGELPRPRRRRVSTDRAGPEGLPELVGSDPEIERLPTPAVGRGTRCRRSTSRPRRGLAGRVARVANWAARALWAPRLSRAASMSARRVAKSRVTSSPHAEHLGRSLGHRPERARPATRPAGPEGPPGRRSRRCGRGSRGAGRRGPTSGRPPRTRRWPPARGCGAAGRPTATSGAGSRRPPVPRRRSAARPLAPRRAMVAWRSRYPSASTTAPSWAAGGRPRDVGVAEPHSTLTDLGAEKVRSNPVTRAAPTGRLVRRWPLGGREPGQQHPQLPGAHLAAEAQRRRALSEPDPGGLPAPR